MSGCFFVRTRMKIIVCDDDVVTRNSIRDMILAEDHDAQVILYESASEVLYNHDADLIILDIQMDGINGIEAAKLLRESGCASPIIFISAVHDYVFEAFEVEALWYLVKPVDQKKFHHVYERAKKIILKSKEAPCETVLFHSKSKNYSLKKDQIIYAESDGKKVILHTGSDRVEIYASMYEVEEKLGEGFFRCHRGFIVNMNRIRSYTGKEIVTSSGDVLLISRDRYRDFVNSYMAFIGEG